MRRTVLFFLGLVACAEGIPDAQPGRPDAGGPGPTDPTPESPTRDAGPSESLDLGPPRPVGPKTGASCSVEGLEVENTCGRCGSQYALCTKTDEGLRIGAYGPCRGEKTGEDTCVPGQDTTSACGYCGTKRTVCRNDCSWIESSCEKQTLDANRCLPGAVEQRVADCSGEDVRSFTCNDSCRWASPTSCGARPTKLDVPPAGVTSTLVVVARPTKGKKPPANCGFTVSSSTVYYNYIELKNPGPTANVEVWDDNSGNYILAAYDSEPSSDIALGECIQANDICFGDTPTPADACLLGGAITIPASSSRVIFVGNSLSTDAAFKTKLSVRRAP